MKTAKELSDYTEIVLKNIDNTSKSSQSIKAQKAIAFIYDQMMINLNAKKEYVLILNDVIDIKENTYKICLNNIEYFIECPILKVKNKLESLGYIVTLEKDHNNQYNKMIINYKV